jgi:hypothetical protein
MIEKTERERLVTIANERLLGSKAFCIFCMDDKGHISYTGYSDELNPAEILGLVYTVKNFDFGNVRKF